MCIFAEGKIHTYFWSLKMICDSKAHMLSTVSKVLNTYHWFTSGEIPEGKNPKRVDQKLIALYGCESTRSERQRKARAKEANALYFRYKRFWALLATDGEGEIHDCEPLRSARGNSLVIFNHSVKLADSRVVVRVESSMWGKLRERVRAACFIENPNVLEALIRDQVTTLGLIPFRGTIEQQETLLRMLNEKRKHAGLPKLRKSCLIYRRDN